MRVQKVNKNTKLVNPLSFRTYITRNLSKVVPFLLIISLSLVVILMSKLFLTSVENDYKTYNNFWKKYSTVTINTAEFRNGFAEIDSELKNLQNSENIVTGVTKKISITSLFGLNPYKSDFVDEAEINNFISTVGWKLVEGRLPIVDKNEILLTQEALKNKNLKIGDKVGNSVNENEDLVGEYTIVGALEGKEVNGAVGVINPQTEQTAIWTFYIQPKPGKENELSAELNKLKATYKNQIDFKEYATIVEQQAGQFTSINSIIWGINILTSGVMTMSIILLAYIFIVSRMKEFAIFEALGYQRTRIIIKVLTEFGFISVIAWIFGFLVTELISKVVNYFLLDPVAITPITVLNIEILIFSLPMLLILTTSIVVLVLLKFQKMDPIVIIEQR